VIHNVDVGRQVVFEHVAVLVANVVEVLQRPEIAVVQGDDFVVRRQSVREIQSDEPGTAGNKHALVSHIESQRTR